MKVIALDHETPLVRAAYQAPPIVCGQWCEIAQGGRVGAGHVELPHVYLPRLVQWLREPETLIVGAETAFEILTSCTTVDLWGREEITRVPASLWPDMPAALGLDPTCPGTSLLELWVAAIDQDRVTDIFIRQKLLDLARGCYRYERNLDGTTTGVNKYNLAALAGRLAGIDIPEDNKKCRVCDNTGCPHCPWRLRYASLAGVPVAQWPREAYEYAALDPVATGAVWVAQWRRSTKIEANFPGVAADVVLRGEYDEMRAALPLKAMSAYGLRTEPSAVARFEAHVREQYQEVADALVAAKLLRREWKRDREALKQYVTKHGLDGCFVSTVPDPTGPDGPTGTIPVWSFARACFDRAFACADPDRLRVLRKVYAEQNSDPELLELGLSYVDESRDTKAAHALIAWAWGGQVPKELMTTGGKVDPKKPERKPAPPVPKTDKDSLLLVVDRLESAVGAGSHVQGDQAAWAADVLRDYAELSHLSKQLGTDIPILRDGAERPIHTRYETILETQRTSSSKPNVQNQARGGKVKCRACKGTGRLAGCAAGECPRCAGEGERDLPGTRECFVPRKGWVLIDSDYPMLEIYALAQTCLWELGFSGFAEALKAGQDVHLVVASQICGLTYDEAKQALKDKNHPRHAEVKNARNAGKAVNFGRPGGLSAKTMRSYAVKSYGVSKTVEEWQGIIDVWNATWSEMPAYFAKVNTQESYPKSGLFNVRYASPDGFRALATYCAACNSKYQRLGAKVAKRALWYVFKACYTRTAEGSHDASGAPVLFGCRPNNFIHDQIMTEAPEERAHPAAMMVGELMAKAGLELMPDVPFKMDPILCRRWSKNAEGKLEVCQVCAADEDTRCPPGCSGAKHRQLVPWEDVRLTA